MQIVRLITADGLAEDGDDSSTGLIDLDEYAHPTARAAAWERLTSGRPAGAAPMGVMVPGDVDAADLERAAQAGAGMVVINDAESAAQLRRAGDLLDGQGANVRLIARLTSGRGLSVAREITTAHPRVTGLWYAPADLLVDFDDEPAMLYVYDSGESRLAAPAWTRSLLLTVARAAGISLWGQLDLSFADAPSDVDAARVLRLARLSGFDVLVARHPATVAAHGDGSA
jgi:citrate lyase beta subunit